MATEQNTATKKGATEVQTVKMDDGREVEFPGTRKLQKTVIINGQDVSVRMDFVNGETRTHKLKPELLAKAAGHGLSQKLGDEVSGVKDIEDAITTIDELMVRLDRGEWNEARQTGEGTAGASILAKALIEVSKKSPTEIKDFLSGLDAKQKAALRESTKLKPTIQRLEAEKAARAKPKDAAPAVDTDSLLGGLMGGAKAAPANSVFAQGQAPSQVPAKAPPSAASQGNGQPVKPVTVGNPAATK